MEKETGHIAQSAVHAVALLVLFGSSLRHLVLLSLYWLVDACHSVRPLEPRQLIHEKLHRRKELYVD